MHATAGQTSIGAPALLEGKVDIVPMSRPLTADEVEAFRRKAEGVTQRRQEERDARLSGSMSEAHWFYEKGLRLSQEGKTEEAKKVWDQLIAAFADVEAESVWVERAPK